MMRFYTFILLLLSGSAFAQSGTSITPVHGWLLGPSVLNGSNASGTCILYNQFSDGSGLRFNIKDERIETITVIYRNDIFEPAVSNSYKTILQTTTAYRLVLDGYAYSRNTLTITPPDAAEFYGEMKRNSRLTIAAPRSQKTFNLRNLGRNLEKTKNCVFEDAKPQIVLDETKEVHIFADLTRPKPGSAPKTIWRAERGERLRDVMKRWSDQAGRDLNWKAENNPIINKEFIFEGSQDDALEQLFKVIL